jgi:hypothetical protein
LKRLVTIPGLLLACVLACGQAPAPAAGTPPPPAVAAATAGPGTDGFRSIRLGMTLDEVKGTLLRDPYFIYRGDPDVSFLPLSDQTLIECEGTSYISRAYFQFQGGKLFSMTLVLDASLVDHYSLFTRLGEKYGRYTELTPSRVLWRFDAVDFSLERPLTVRYLDRKAFEDLRTRGVAKEALDDISRRRFLEQF